MAASDQDISLKLEILPQSTHKAFEYLSHQSWLQDDWYLAGGTALALQMKHRLSADLDFFTQKTDFDMESLINHVSSAEWTTTLREKGTLYGELFHTKISFIVYPYFIPKKEFLSFGDINILDKQDIAVMKIIAISQRGRKRDFIDLYWYTKNIEPLLDVMKRVEHQYPTIKHNYHHILKSLVYFDEAEQDPSPHLLVDISWEKVKSCFIALVPKLASTIF